MRRPGWARASYPACRLQHLDSISPSPSNHLSPSPLAHVSQGQAASRPPAIRSPLPARKTNEVAAKLAGEKHDALRAPAETYIDACRCCAGLSPRRALTSRLPSLSPSIVHRSVDRAGDALARAQAIANMDPDLDSGLREGLDGVETNAHPHYDSQTSIPNPPGFLPGSVHDANANALADHAAATLDPDDFYKSFQPAPGPDGEPQSLPMASSVPHLPPSNADGAAARHLQPPANRSAGRQGLRSASSPLDRRAAATTRSSSAARAPSVKDLKKRFDQSGGANSIPRAPPRQEVPVARIRQDSIKPKPKPKPPGPSSSAGPRPGIPAPGSSKQPSSAASTASSSNRPLQKSRNVERDQMPGSSRSFANRIGNHPPPDTSANGNPIASSSLTRRPHNSPPSASQPPAPLPKSNSQFPGLLFGEVAPGQHAAAAGFGIDNLRPRRTSDSNVHGLVGRQRSLSDFEAEPASPSSWYRDLHTSRGSAPKAHHTRSRSDISILPFIHQSSTSPTTTIAALAAATATATAVAAAEAAAPPASHTPTGASSKLPVSISRRLATPSDSSPASSRSNSPSTLRRPPANVRSSSRQAKANPTTTRAKTPTQTPRKQPPSGLVTPGSSNNRLQAYVSVAPPKLSPPLRSSRPRQPVSVATTASSRMKETAKTKPPARPTARDNVKDPSSSKTYDPAKRKIIAVGPIDFEQRREHIRLAYTKTIRESQAFEARQRAVERRRKQMEEAKAKAAATSTVTATDSPTPVTAGEKEEDANQETAEGDAALKAETGTQSTGQVDSPSPQSGLANELPGELPADHGTHVVEKGESLPETPTAAASRPAFGKDHDSPTLGIPGSFPGTSPSANVTKAQRPLSTISITSAVTEFDIEPQAELSDLAMSDQPLSPQIIVPTRERSHYRSPFDDDDFPSSPPQPSPAAHPHNLAHHRDQNHHHDHQHYADQGNNPVPYSQIDGQEQFRPEAYYNNEHQEASFEPPVHQNYQPIVKILPQPSANELPAAKEAVQAASYPRLDIQDESDCHSDLESAPAMARHMRSDVDDAATDACTEETDDRDAMEDERSPYRYGGHLSSNRASTCASSDIETFDELLYPSHDDHIDAGPPNKLLAPPSISRADRSSHQTAWTNVSVDGTHSEASESPDMRSASWKLSESSGRDDSSLRSFSYSGAGGVRPSVDSTRSSIQLGQQLPELDTGGGFSIPYLSTEATSDFSYLSSPKHEPPPLPHSGRNSALESQTSSVFYEQSQYGSTLVNSDRGSGEYISHHSETPLSMMDMTSMETTDQYFDGRGAVDSDARSFIQEAEGLSSEERHRLIQRRNVIKELIDTEAVFVRDMNIIEEIYKGTAEACPKLDAKIVKLIFRNSDEIIEFHTSFLAILKEVVASIYVPKSGRSLAVKGDSFYSEQSQSSIVDLSDAKDRETSLGPAFQSNMERMKLAHEGFLRNSDQAAKKLIQIQQDPTVQIWLNECNEVAKDLTTAWDLDSLLIKPMQRITKYPNLIMTLLQHTPQDHPDREPLIVAKEALEDAIIEINKTKKNFELVGQIVGRKRKESDVKAGLARAFGKKVDKLQGGAREPEDPEYLKLEERFSDDYLRLQVVLRDVEFYTRQVSSYVHEFLQFLSAIELVMRLQPGSFPELESKWVQFNISIRDIEKITLELHLTQIRKHVIEPFEHVIKSYGNPSLAMKKRQKRRIVWERAEQLKKAGKSIDPKLKELVEQYEALNDTLIKELPKLSALTEKMGNICLSNLINIQADWYFVWREKMRAVLADAPELPALEDIVAVFQRDFPYANEMMSSIGIINPAYRGRISQSTASGEDALPRTRGRTSEAENRSLSQSMNVEAAPVLPAPDFGKRHSGSFTLSPISSNATGFGATAPSPHQYYYRDFYAGLSNNQAGMGSPQSADAPTGSRSLGNTRPSTGKSFDSSAMTMAMATSRQSSESAPHIRRDSGNTFYSSYHQNESRRFSNLFHSALPLPDGPGESQRSSRASSRERAHASDGYNVLWLAASLFEFNISTTKHEAGYPYLTYQAGEIFDVIAEKGELWLAKNQDDPSDQVGWIWSKHFAKLADS